MTVNKLKLAAQLQMGLDCESQATMYHLAPEEVRTIIEALRGGTKERPQAPKDDRPMVEIEFALVVDEDGYWAVHGEHGTDYAKAAQHLADEESWTEHNNHWRRVVLQVPRPKTREIRAKYRSPGGGS